MQKPSAIRRREDKASSRRILKPSKIFQNKKQWGASVETETDRLQRVTTISLQRAHGLKAPGLSRSTEIWRIGPGITAGQ